MEDPGMDNFNLPPQVPNGMDGNPPTTDPQQTPASQHPANDVTTQTTSHHLASTTDITPTDISSSFPPDRNPELTDLGWHQPPGALPSPLLPHSLSNSQLWALIRRFDKQVCHVKTLPAPPPSGLDLEIAPHETFTPVKFKTHLERLYMTLVVGAFTAWKHVVRLRSWREGRRTGAFMAVYVAAWMMDWLGVVVVLWAMGLVLVPEWRRVCFPPAPPSLIRGDGKGVKKPMAGVLASEGSVTGAPEKQEGEAVEQEAHSFVNSVITLAVGLAGDRNPQDISDTKYQTGALRAVEQDKTKKPVTDMVFGEAEEVMHMIAQVCRSSASRRHERLTGRNRWWISTNASPTPSALLHPFQSSDRD